MPATSTSARLIAKPVTFWTGVALTCAGVGEHVWMFASAAPMHFQLAMMPMSPLMWAAMALIVIGVVMSAYALIRPAGRRAPHPAADGSVRTGRLVGVLSFALLVDQMKPATVAFIEPGMRAEYHLSQGQVAWLPAVALSGTVAGSLVWGRSADRIGRRATILSSSLLFLGTTVCGAMPSFTGNLIMCWLMGMAAGGMLPVVYALMSESLPPGGRGVVMVLQAGLTSTGGYMAASGLAALLVPLAGWRVLWFAQLPLVLILIALNGWIPESAAFASRRSRDRPIPASALLRRPNAGKTLIVSGYALAWGLTYWGFVTFLPTLLATSGGQGMSAATLLFLSSLLAIPTCALGAWSYARWSAKGTMAASAALTVAALAALAALGPAGARVALMCAIMALLAGTSGIISLLGPYIAETYPTGLRGTASGWGAAMSKSGGAFGPPLIAALLSATGGMRVTALLVALPLAVAAFAILVGGSEPHSAAPYEGEPAAELMGEASVR